MDKEEIEEIKKLLFQDRLTQYGKRKLVQYLEQKESILDKVKEIAKYFDTTENTIRTAIVRKSKRNCRYIIIKVAD